MTQTSLFLLDMKVLGLYTKKKGYITVILPGTWSWVYLASAQIVFFANLKLQQRQS